MCKFVRLLLIVACAVMLCHVAMGQGLPAPRYVFRASDVVDGLPVAMRCVTNHNPSVDLGDSVLSFPLDSLRYDGEATIFTVYETDADSVVGLWQVGSGGNRTLWLNSRQVSFGSYTFAYRSDNEHGVIVHTMCYRHPAVDSAYVGSDTLYLGREGGNIGEKRLCALYYFRGSLPFDTRRRLESALAIRHGAWLHGPYVNSLLDTLWNPAGGDSVHSSGVCGIGRDDSLTLRQQRSIVRGDILTVSADTLCDRCHVMLGHDAGSLVPTADTVVDSTRYRLLERRWKLRAHTGGQPVAVRFAVALPLLSESVRLMLCSDGDTVLLAASSADSLVFGPVALVDGRDYLLSVLAGAATSLPTLADYGTDAAVAPDKDEEKGAVGLSDDIAVSVTPNPTTGDYRISVRRPAGGAVDIRVVDMQGRVVARHSAAAGKATLQYSGRLRENGIHYVHVTCNGRSHTVKLLVTP